MNLSPSASTAYRFRSFRRGKWRRVGTIYATNLFVQVGLPASGGSVPGSDAIRLFIVGWVGGDSGRRSPGRLLLVVAQGSVPASFCACETLLEAKAGRGLEAADDQPIAH